MLLWSLVGHGSPPWNCPLHFSRHPRPKWRTIPEALVQEVGRERREGGNPHTRQAPEVACSPPQACRGVGRGSSWRKAPPPLPSLSWPYPQWHTGAKERRAAHVDCPRTARTQKMLTWVCCPSSEDQTRHPRPRRCASVRRPLWIPLEEEEEGSGQVASSRHAPVDRGGV